MLGAKGRGVLLLVLLALATSRAALSAEIRPGKEPGWKREMRQKLETRVDCDFDDTPLAEAISTLRRRTGVPITLDESADVAWRHGHSFKFENGRLCVILEVLLKQQGDLDYVLRKDGVFISTRKMIGKRGELRSHPEYPFWMRKQLGRRVSFEFVDTPLTEAVLFIQTLTRINMILDPRAIQEGESALITLRMSNEPLKDAFDRVVEIAGLDYELVDDAFFISTLERIDRLVEFNARVGAAEAGLADDEELEWRRGMHKLLARKVSFEFVDTPVNEAMVFLQTLTKTTFIIDPHALKGREGTAVSLRVSNMRLDLALKWILRLAGLRHTLKDQAVWISTPDRILAGLRSQAKPEAAKAAPEWEHDFRKHLQRKVSFELVDTPLSETIQFLMTMMKLKMILDPRAVEERGDTPINLKVTDMSLELALDWILRLADLDYTFKDGAIFISTPEVIARQRKAGAGDDTF